MAFLAAFFWAGVLAFFRAFLAILRALLTLSLTSLADWGLEIFLAFLMMGLVIGLTAFLWCFFLAFAMHFFTALRMAFLYLPYHALRRMSLEYRLYLVLFCLRSLTAVFTSWLIFLVHRGTY